MMRLVTGLVIVTWCFCATATADLSGLNPWTDPDGFTWARTTELKAEKDGEFLWADVEWVVEWVGGGVRKFKYIYQIESKGEFAVVLLGVSMLEGNEAENIGAYQVEEGNVAPLSYGFLPDPPAEPSLARWAFAGLGAGQVSYGLTYWSVNAPHAIGGYIQDGGIFAVHGDLPSPSSEIPEPVALSVLAVGGIGALVRRRKRH